VRSRGLLVVISFVASLAAMSIATVSTATAAVPTGFSDTLLFNVGGPTAIAFTPDGRMLITTQGGALRVVTAGGSLVAAPAVTVPDVCSNSERGLLGVAVDPMFISNQRDRRVPKSRESMVVERQQRRVGRVRAH
jgi:glucose/arabinose dehydrogenase